MIKQPLEEKRHDKKTIWWNKFKLGLGFFNSAIEHFPHHLLSGIFCFVAITIIILGVLTKKKNRLITFIIIIIFTVLYFLITNGILFDSFKKYEAYDNLNKYDIKLTKESYVSGFLSSKEGSAEIEKIDGKYQLKLVGVKNTIYKFGISDDNKSYYKVFDEDNNLQKMIYMM